MASPHIVRKVQTLAEIRPHGTTPITACTPDAVIGVDQPFPGAGAQVGTGSDDGLDAALVAARAGDEDAFVVLWRALHPPLVRYLAARGDQPVDDIASETWLHALRGLSSFEGGASEFRAWLFTIARHRAIDQGRARSRRPAVPVADPTLVVDEDREHEPSAEQQVTVRLETAQVLELVGGLPPSQAEMVLLRVVAGLEVADVARMVEKSPGAVRVGVHRALKALAADPRIRRDDQNQSQKPSQNQKTRKVV